MESGPKSEAKQDEEGSSAMGGGGGGGSSRSSKVYHERQRLQFCLLHALNNLMQEKESFTRAELDGIAGNLVQIDPNKEHWTPMSLIFKPHHNVFTGNYDVNVLITALEARKKKVVWHDHRKGASSIDLDADALFGLMINVPVRRFRGLWTGRHWVAIRSINGTWFNLDSDFSAPKEFQDKEKLIAFLDSILSQGGEVMIVLQDE
uniref:ubiquitinyl hydrolase 1 n=1 Tax=Oryza meridionalis TaxID=40149 RepID=A0A0E0CYG3_9ORYZ